MALLLSNSLEGGTQGTSLTAGNTGGLSGTAFDAIVGTAPAFDSHRAGHGVYGFNAVTTGQSMVSWTTSLGSLTELWARFNFQIAGNSSANNPIIYFRDQLGNNVCGIRITTGTTGLAVTANGSTNVVAFTNTIPANQWVRLELHAQLTGGNAVADARLYSVMDSTILTETQSHVIANATATSWGSVRIGNNLAQTALVWFDDIVVTDQGFPGPVNVPQLIPQQHPALGALRRGTPRHGPPVMLIQRNPLVPAGNVQISGTGASTVTFTAASTGTTTNHLFSGTGAATVTFTAAATGVASNHAVAGVGASTVTFTAAATGAATNHLFSGTAASTVAFTALVNGSVGGALPIPFFQHPRLGVLANRRIGPPVRVTQQPVQRLLYVGSATASVAFTAAATGTATNHLFSGSGTASVTFTAAATGTATRHLFSGTATATVTFTAAATGRVIEEGTGASTVTFTASATGQALDHQWVPMQHPRLGVLRGARRAGPPVLQTQKPLAIPGAAQIGTAAASVTFTAAATGKITAEGIATSSVAITASATGHVLEHGTAAMSVTFTAAATGTATRHVFSGSGASAVTFSASATGHILNHGSGAAAVSFTGLGAGTVVSHAIQGVGTGSVSFSGNATGTSGKWVITFASPQVVLDMRSREVDLDFSAAQVVLAIRQAP